jgi:hypothetical protein
LLAAYTARCAVSFRWSSAAPALQPASKISSDEAKRVLCTSLA